LLPAIFFRQKAAFCFDCVACFGQVPCRSLGEGGPCQKQPSTKTASRCARKTKSGRTVNRAICLPPALRLPGFAF